MKEVSRLESAELQLTSRSLKEISENDENTGSNENLRGYLPRNDSEMSLGLNRSTSIAKDLGEMGEFCQGGKMVINYFKNFGIMLAILGPSFIILSFNPHLIPKPFYQILFGFKDSSR